MDYEYDVAFSFHSSDEFLARALNDLLSDRFKTFIYTERQENLAGRDGEEAFNEIFLRAARTVVVFSRQEWGKTPFTRIEETAIKNRAFDTGYGFALFIPTTKPAWVPQWLPRTQLWLGLDRFGLPGAAAVIESKIQETGGETSEETAEARAIRFKRAAQLNEAKKQFKNSERGVTAASESFENLIAIISERLKKMGLAYSFRPNDHSGLHVLRFAGVFALIYWRVLYQNSLDGTELEIEIWDGMPKLPGYSASFKEARRLETLLFHYELLHEDTHAFVEKSKPGTPFDAKALAERILKICMDLGETTMR